MPQLDMNLISETEAQGRSVYVAPPGQPAVRSKGSITYRCGSCKTKLLETVAFDQVRNIVVKCGKCERYNEVPQGRG